MVETSCPPNYKLIREISKREILLTENAVEK